MELYIKMIALIGSLIGFLGSMAPHIFSIFQTKTDNLHELAIMDRQADLQLKMQAAGAISRAAEIQSNFDIADSQAIHAPQQIIGIWLIDFLNGSVRPVLTYAFFIAYVVVKYAQWHILQQTHFTDSWSIVLDLWNDEDKAIFAGIISFYFGARTMNKVMGK